MNPGLHIVHHATPDTSELEKHIIRTLVYFDIFRHPLTVQEIVRFMGTTPQHFSDVERTLAALCDDMRIFRFNELYCLHNDSSIAARRVQGNQHADEVMPKALRRSKLIQRFPFVRSVNISGSLSKHYFDAQSDVDFFVIAAPNRLWLCRLFLTIFKKIFLLNARKYFCINYYVDTDNLLIPDKNLFSATEIITLKNHTGAEHYDAFMAANQWVTTYFPNHDIVTPLSLPATEPAFKRLIEKLFSGKPGDKLDDWAFAITTRFLRKKYKHLSDREFAVSLRARKHASKHHPQGFQFRVMEAFEKQCAAFEEKHGISLH